MFGGDLAFGSVISEVCLVFGSDLAFGSVIDQRFAWCLAAIWRLVASYQRFAWHLVAIWRLVDPDIRGLLGVW